MQILYFVNLPYRFSKEEQILKKFLEKTSSFALCLAEIVIGVLLLISPVGFTSGIIIGVGAVLLVMGLISIVHYFRSAPAEAAKDKGLAKGLCAAVAGLFCMLRHQWFIATFPLLTMLYGAAILITGIARIQWTVDMLRVKNNQWRWAAASAALAVVFAVIILLNPFATTAVLWVFVGVSLIVEAVVDAISIIFTRHARKKSA